MCVDLTSLSAFPKVDTPLYTAVFLPVACYGDLPMMRFFLVLLSRPRFTSTGHRARNNTAGFPVHIIIIVVCLLSVFEVSVHRAKKGAVLCDNDFAVCWSGRGERDDPQKYTQTNTRRVRTR